MVELKKVDALGIEYMDIISKLPELAEEAKRMSAIVFSKKWFKIGENTITVKEEPGGFYYEYLTYGGIWKVVNIENPEEYEVDCTPEGIYECLKAELYIKRKLVEYDLYNEYGKKAEALKYFRRFLRRISEEESS